MQWSRCRRGELAHYSVQSDEAIAVYKAITQSPNSAIARRETIQSLDDSNPKISYRNCLIAVLVYIVFSVFQSNQINFTSSSDSQPTVERYSFSSS